MLLIRTIFDKSTRLAYLSGLKQSITENNCVFEQDISIRASLVLRH
jgi:hypothetical protein